MTAAPTCPERTFSLREVGGELQRLTAELKSSIDREGHFANAMIRAESERDEARAEIERLCIGRLPADHRIEELRVHRALVRDLWDAIETAKPVALAELLTDIVRDFVAEHGEECEVCGGSGEVREELDGFSPSAVHYNYRTRVASECGSCRGGRTPR